MRLLAALAVLIAVSPVLAQSKLQILPTPAGEPPIHKMLHRYLLAEAQKHFDARRKEVAALKTTEQVQQRQARLKKLFIGALGGLPKKTPLNAKVTGKLDCGDYLIEKVIYESRPNHHVTAALYLPKNGSKPCPGVLMPCGHSANGKAAVPYQRICILLAKHGIAALCYDPVGQGERLQLLNDKGTAAIPGSTSEHTMMGVGALLIGRNTASYHIWDGMRSLDYLASRPEIDATRLGCTGNSGGGTLTAYLMALDERIVAAAPSCYITSLERLFQTLGPQDAEQNITGQVAFGMEHADYVTMRAPLPTLILTGTQDFFDIQGAWTSFREAKLLYGLLGHGERVDLFEYNDKHGFSKPRREAALRWMRRWLLKIDDAPFESDFPNHTDAELQCTRTGQVLSDLHGKSVFDLNAEEETRLARVRQQWQKSHAPAELQKQIRGLIGLPALPDTIKVEKLGTVEQNGCTLHKLAFHTEPGITVPALDCVPVNGKGNGATVLYVSDRGAAAEAQPNGPIEKLVKQGNRVLAVDLRGLGETAVGPAQRGMAKYFGAEWPEAFLALHLNRPLLGQRVYDLLAVIHSSACQDTDKLHVVGVGQAAPIVLHAAVLEPRITQVTTEKGLISWANVVHTPLSHQQLANVVPGALKYYDLPDLARLIGSRSLTIRQPVDAVGQPAAKATGRATKSAG